MLNTYNQFQDKAEAVNLNRLTYFAAVVEAGSFTRAAERLHITKAVVSQQIAKLERELKTSLLHRTTRRVEVTDTGKLLYARCTLIMREAEDAFHELAQANEQPTGLLRISAPNDYGTSAIASAAVRFGQRYPDCQVELLLSDTRVDLIANQIDLSIRVGWLSDSSLKARRIGSFKQMLVAAPGVVAKARLKKPADIESLPFIANGALSTPLVWQFTLNKRESQTVHMKTALKINTTPAVLQATLAGGGLSVLPDFLVKEQLNNGTLAHVLPDWSLAPGGLYAVYPPSHFRSPKVTRFLEVLQEKVV
jgi:DNA-binding transcriptional LysR family regulator